MISLCPKVRILRNIEERRMLERNVGSSMEIKKVGETGKKEEEIKKEARKSNKES